MPRLPASSGLLRAQEGELLVLRTNNSPEQAPEKVSTPSQPSPRGRAWSLRSESACCITFRLPSRRPFLFHNTLLCSALPCPVPPSEGEALSRIFHSPSEGAQMGHRPENACSRVSISNRPYTPSEGETLSRIFHSPSEGAQMGHRPENACSRVSISNRPYTPSEGETLSRIFRSPSEGAHFTHSSGIAIFAARNIETFTTNQITTEDDYHRTGERLASAYRYAGEVSLTSLRRRSR